VGKKFLDPIGWVPFREGPGPRAGSRLVDRLRTGVNAGVSFARSPQHAFQYVD